LPLFIVLAHAGKASSVEGMRSFCLLSILAVAAGDLTTAEKGQCLVDSGEAISDAMDAALFIWAAAKRCGKTNLELKCSIDILAATKSVNSMVNVVLATLNKCEALHGANKACGMQASKLTEYTAGLGESATMVAQKCEANHAPAASTGQGAVMCTLSLKNTGKHLFKAISAIQKATSSCNHGDNTGCAANTLEIIASLAAMGEYVAATVGQCQRATGALASRTKEELCAGAVQGLVSHTAKASEAGINLHKACSPGASEPNVYVMIDKTERKYDANDDAKIAGIPIANFVLAAFLPVSAVVGFVGGRFYAGRRDRTDQTREFMSDHE